MKRISLTDENRYKWDYQKERNAETRAAIDYARNREIAHITVDERRVKIELVGGDELRIWDWGQQCCEIRFLSCDDNVSAFVGARFVDAETRPVTDAEFHRVRDNSGAYEGEEDDPAFLIISTTLGEFTVVTHNIHNGYYGGFEIRAKIMEA